MQNTYTTEELLMEQLWENEMIRKGREKYYAALESTDLADSAIGLSLVMQITPQIIKAIEDKQAEYADALLGENKKAIRNSAPYLMSMVPADTLGVALAQTMCALMLNAEEVTLRMLLDRLEESYIQAMGLTLWEQQDKDAYSYFWNTQADKLASTGANSELAKKRRQRLKAKMTQLWEEFADQGDETQAVQLAVAQDLLQCVGFTRVTAIAESRVDQFDPEELVLVDEEVCVVEKRVGPCSGMFILREHWNAGITERHMFLTEETANAIDWSIERGAIASTDLRPMLIKPRRWILEA